MAELTRAGAWFRLVLAVAVATATMALVGCGSSKPAYCTDRTNLQNSVKALNVSDGVSGLKTQVAQIQSDATALVSSAKGDFPSETGAITSSVDALKGSVTALPSSLSVAQFVTVTKDAASVKNSVTSFMDASNSACS
jgi:outer membrane murein-binding lipoprotein Lpp